MFFKRLLDQGKWGQTHSWRAGCELEGWEVRGGGTEQKGKGTCGPQCSDCWEVGIRGLGKIQ